MKYINEYRNQDIVQKYSEQLHLITTKAWNIMEVCGGQTHTIIKYGIDTLLPPQIQLIHGPGCPVCVTSVELIDKAIMIALRKDVIFCTFGDMLRVPGSNNKDLFLAKAQGADIRVVYSPLDCLDIAKQNTSKNVVFFGIGFETTAPATAFVVKEAIKNKLNNFFMLVTHVLVPPAMKVILHTNDAHIDGFLAAGHVCTVMGYEEYEILTQEYKKPIVVTGFEPADIMQGIYMCVKQLENGHYTVENQYKRSVKKEGNIHAKNTIFEVFKIVDRKWRGLGMIPKSGLSLKPEFEHLDAEVKFNLTNYSVDESEDCIIGLVLKGIKKPHECPLFGIKCNPENPLGASMVSTEGVCSAYYKYKKSIISNPS